jgi:RHS repeat-associated protein
MTSYTNSFGDVPKYVSYDYTGKVTAVYKDAAKTQALATFLYDEKGHRIRKTQYNASSPYNAVAHTYYVNDAQGTPLSVYYVNVGSAAVQEEIFIYGNNRIGVVNKYGTAEYDYEIKDHLGNVRAVVRKNTTTHSVEVINYSDYYPHGGVMAGRHYEYLGFNPRNNCYQGENAERDDETGYIDFDLRMYDSDIARWFVPDPMNQHFSPYLAMGNNPISFTDATGGEDEQGSGPVPIEEEGGGGPREEEEEGPFSKTKNNQGKTSPGTFDPNSYDPRGGNFQPGSSPSEPSSGPSSSSTFDDIGGDYSNYTKGAPGGSDPFGGYPGGGINLGGASGSGSTNNYTQSATAFLPPIVIGGAIADWLGLGIGAGVFTYIFSDAITSDYTTRESVSYSIILGTVPPSSLYQLGHSFIGLTTSTGAPIFWHQSNNNVTGFATFTEVSIPKLLEMEAAGAIYSSKSISESQYYSALLSVGIQKGKGGQVYNVVLNNCVTNVKTVLYGAALTPPTSPRTTPMQLAEWFNSIK